MTRRRTMVMARTTAMAIATALLLAACETGTDLPDLTVHTMEVGPAGPVTLVVGDTVWLTAHPKTEDGLVLGSAQVDWSTDAAQVAEISANGLIAVVRAMATGTTVIRAASGGRTASVTVTVENVPVESVAVSPDTVALVIGAEARLEAALYAADGTSLENRQVAWSSASHAIATVDGTGLVTAHGAGVVLIRAESEGVGGEAVVIVEEPETPAAYVVVTAPQPRMWIGQTRSVLARVLDASGLELEGRAVTWSVGDEAVATVDAAGEVTAMGEGATQVRATSGGVTGYTTIRSHAHPVTGVQVLFSGTLSDTSVTMVSRSIQTTWVDSLGVEHDAFIIAESGSLSLDWTTGSGYQQVLIFGTYITEDYQAKRVAETEHADAGTVEVWYDWFTGEHIYRLASSTTDDLVYWATWSLPGELRVMQPAGAIDSEVQPYYFDMLLP